MLHGDLHHDNILQNGNYWVVIDPKGLIGEPAYEVSSFIRNSIPELLNHADAPNIIHNRVTRFAAALELPERRIIFIDLQMNKLIIILAADFFCYCCFSCARWVIDYNYFTHPHPLNLLQAQPLTLQ